MSAKESRIAFRASEDTKKRFAAVAKKVRLKETDLALACAEALIEYIEEHGEITMPLAVLPKSQLSAGKTELAGKNAKSARSIEGLLSPETPSTAALNEETGARIPPVPRTETRYETKRKAQKPTS